MTPAGRRLLAKAKIVFDDELLRRLDGVLSVTARRHLATSLSELRRSLEQDPTTGGVGRQVR